MKTKAKVFSIYMEMTDEFAGYPEYSEIDFFRQLQAIFEMQSYDFKIEAIMLHNPSDFEMSCFMTVSHPVGYVYNIPRFKKFLNLEMLDELGIKVIFLRVF